MTGDVGINVLQRKTVQTSGAHQSLFSLLVISWFLTTISVCGGSLSLALLGGRWTVDGQRCFEQRTAAFSVNGFMILNGQRRTMFYSVQRNFRARSRPEALNRSSSGRALRDDALFLLQVILAWFRPGSRSLPSFKIRLSEWIPGQA